LFSNSKDGTHLGDGDHFAEVGLDQKFRRIALLQWERQNSPWRWLQFCWSHGVELKFRMRARTELTLETVAILLESGVKAKL
jgi:hypothetical protein